MIRVLYVDNEESLLDITRRYLQRDKDLIIETENNPESAVNRLSRESFDAIISDYDMPEMNGIEFLRSVRLINPSIPFIVFSSKGREELIIASLNEGADYYVQKGQDINSQYAELSHKIRQAVEKRRIMASLKESEEQFRALTEQSPDVILRFDRNFRIVYYNKTFQSIHKSFSREDIGTDIRTLPQVPHLKELWIQQISKVFDSGEPSRCEFMVPDGKWVNWLLFPEFDTEGRVKAVISSARDITTSKRNEDEREHLINDLTVKQEFINALLDALPIPVLWKDKDDRYAGCNKAFTRISGISSEELIGKGVFEVWPEESASLFQETDEKLMKNHLLPPFFSNFYDRKGTRYEVIFSKNLFLDYAGNKAGIVCVFLDMTEQNKLMRDLREREELFRMIVTRSSDIFVILSTDLQISYISPRVEELTGFLLEELLGPVDRFIHPDDIEDLRKKLTRLYHNPTGSEKAEFRSKTRTGEYLIFEADAVNCFESPGISGFLISARDITARKQTEMRLARTRNISRHLFNHTPALIAVMDTSGSIFFANSAFSDFFGVNISKIKGVNLMDILNPPCRDHFSRIFNEIIQENKPKVQDCTITDKNTDIYLSTALFPFLEEDSRLIGFIGIDLTEIKQMSLDLDQSEIQKQVLEKLVQERTAEVTRLLDQKDLLIQQIAHDMRTPLTPLTFLLPILLDEERDPQRREIVKTLVSSAHKLSNVVEKVLILAKLRSLYQISNLKEIKLKKLIDLVFDQYKPFSEEKNLVITREIDPHISIVSSPIHLEPILDNLISNAIKYSSFGGTISMATRNTNEGVEISLSDDGIGLSEYDIAHIFEPFYKADRSRHDLYSTGLGLSITKRLVEAIGGEIHISSRGQGKGTDVLLILKNPKPGTGEESPRPKSPDPGV